MKQLIEKYKKLSSTEIITLLGRDSLLGEEVEVVIGILKSRGVNTFKWEAKIKGEEERLEILKEKAAIAYEAIFEESDPRKIDEVSLIIQDRDFDDLLEDELEGVIKVSQIIPIKVKEEKAIEKKDPTLLKTPKIQTSVYTSLAESLTPKPSRFFDQVAKRVISNKDITRSAKVRELYDLGYSAKDMERQTTWHIGNITDAIKEYEKRKSEGGTFKTIKPSKKKLIQYKNNKKI